MKDGSAEQTSTQMQRDTLNQHIEKHNESQRAIVQRSNDLVKMLLVTSGGALAVCATFFSAKVEIPIKAVLPIQIAWISLSGAITLFGLTLILILARDSWIGKEHGAMFNAAKLNKLYEPREPSSMWARSIWTCGLIGFISFVVGMGLLTYSACVFLASNAG
jgi:hypothetical protein